MQLTFLEDENTSSSASTWWAELLRVLEVDPSTAWPDRFGTALQQWCAKPAFPPVRTLSLFSGGGGLDIAFHDAGFDVVEMVEIDPRYSETLRKNFAAKSTVTCTDIHDFVPDDSLQIDFIIGGPPCQTFSAAGRRAAGVAGTDDPRGTLFQEYIRLLSCLQPEGFLFENVYGITGAQNGKAWQTIQTAFKAAGYNIFFRVLDAADYGVPQHRERLFIVGLKTGEFLFPYPTHGPDSPGQEAYYSAGEAVKGADITHATQGIGGRYGHLLNDIPPGLNYSFYTKEMGHPNPVFSWRSKFSDFLYKADPERPVRTIKAQGGQYTGPFSWDNRPFTLSELKRLQTFPDSYQIIGARQVCIEQIGNSVPPQLGRMLALSILDQVIGVRLPFQMQYLPHNKVLGFRQRKRALTEIYAIKAKKAIDTLVHRNSLVYTTTNISPQISTRFLGKNFSWTNASMPASSEFGITFSSDDSAWSITVNPPYSISTQQEGITCCIEVFPVAQEQWALPVHLVKLSTNYLEQKTLTALWKAFEEKVLEQTGIADLVQLSGYYQYQPQIKARFSSTSQLDPFWYIVKLITERVGVGRQLSSEKLARLWTCNPDKLLDYLLQLRDMGFEVRSHKTNPQIALGDYLIPYIFPTLTPKSVQLRKSLRENYG